MKFVKEIVAGMIWLDQLSQLSAQRLDLLVIQGPNAGEVAVSVEEIDLIAGESILIPIRMERMAGQTVRLQARDVSTGLSSLRVVAAR